MGKILITGGCGFIGLNLIEFLQKAVLFDYELTVLDNLSLGRKEYLSGYDVRFIEGDIRDRSLARQVVQGMNAIVHLAADTRVMDSISNPYYNFDVNVNGTFNMLDAARSEGVEHFVLASTGGAVLGEARPPVNENMVPRPIAPYGASKLSAEGYCSAFAGSYGMKTVSLRFSNVYGPYSFHKGSVVATFFRQILKGESLTVYGDGEQVRDFVFSRDLCEAIANALHAEKGGEVYQLGSGIGTSVNELISKIKIVVGPKYPCTVQYKPYRPGEIKSTYADISKARGALKFDPTTKLSNGLEDTWDWFCRCKNRFV